ncbi:hypothetical protein FRACYDRAFT_235292 [Fragilariopsis cylindrus CCMP1102]|uniref:Uncharacterized protein n=1 Tax=Fragilariopsis cylindrus CCMP1102 TaxID=635003 RepID=A0A1E7FM87_9STRA|nr:hypothetical protein FRACYDRAFT_235292 [Fragilariopsis cylindrus CCMP1102]|eukprot:OEU19244.1 hypothetical protein FRACYDRAFT_235292 [Fragilariopsis cylindrus CCMP1102]
MLAADKLQLQSALKQQATALKEKEFNLHVSNMNTVGTIAAVLAGLDITMFIEFNPAENITWGDENMVLVARILKFFYYITIVSAFCANMIVVSQTTTLSVLGAGMALRGPDGSMMTATDGIYDERSSVFSTFGVGLACTVGSVVICVWLLLAWEAAICCMILVLYTCRTIWCNYQRVKQRFDFDENETVDFRDIMEGPANIQAVYNYRSNNSSSSSKNRNRHNNNNSNGYNNNNNNNNNRRQRRHNNKNNNYSTQSSQESSTEIDNGGIDVDENDYDSDDDWSAADWKQQSQRRNENGVVKKRIQTV